MGKKRPGPEQEPPPGPDPGRPVVRGDWETVAERILRAPAKPPSTRPNRPFKTRDTERKR